MQLVQQAQRSEGERVLNSQIRRISELDPAVKTLADIAGMDTFPQFDALVRSGVPLDVAYKAVNFERRVQLAEMCIRDRWRAGAAQGHERAQHCV